MAVAALLASPHGCGGDVADQQDASSEDVRGEDARPADDRSPADDAPRDDGSIHQDAAPTDDAHRADVDATDAACTCGWDPDIGASTGIVTLDCYCGRLGECPDYDTARTTCHPFAAKMVTHPDCNLEVIYYQTEASEPGVGLAYDASTHKLVGASYTGTSSTRACGSRTVASYRAGIMPPPLCRPSGPSRPLCHDDAGPAPDIRVD
jgi:hypothetical protein